MDTNELKKEILYLKNRIIDLENERRHLTQIGLKLSVERDISNLLEFILTDCRKMLHADGGSLYIVETIDTHRNPTDPHFYLDATPVKKILRFMIAQNDSKDIPFKQFTIPIDRQSIAGFVADTGEPLNLPDVQKIPADIGIQYNREFDKSIGYKTKSMLTLPLKNLDSEVVGVLQLINKKKNPRSMLNTPADSEQNVLPFSDRDMNFLLSLSSQAAISIERTRLYEEIQSLITGMIEASVSSIEARDLTTSGHSKRIGAYMVALAREINKEKSGHFKEINFTEDRIRELYFSALLHDIGKIGIRENVLMKSTKISISEIEALKWRFNYIKLSTQHNPQSVTFEGMSREEFIEKSEDFIKTISKINNGGFLPENEKNLIEHLSGVTFTLDGEEKSPLLNEYETKNLLIPRGNLTDEEREDINSHVKHSLEILAHIPWTRNLKNVPFIASTHHEKIDGTGYPFELKGDEIPMGGRILAVIDIFEALTARDRPYKPPMPIEKSLKILKEEAELNHIDRDIVDLFISKKVYAIFSDEERKKLGEKSSLQILKSKGLF